MIPPGPFPVPKLPSPVTRGWRVPGSKSITNRALVLAALSDGVTVIANVLESEDTARMREGLEALGIAVEIVRDQRRGDDTVVAMMKVQGGRSRLRVPSAPLFAGNSGTTVRFLAALAVLAPGPVTLVGDADMAKRPIADLVEGLRQLGVVVDCPTGCPPLTVHGTGGRIAAHGLVTLRGDRSSQYLSALLMAAGLYDRDVTIRVTGDLVSRPYVDMTTRMVEDFGGDIEETPEGFIVRGRQTYKAPGDPPHYRVEADASAASYPFALAAATGSTITVPGLGPGSFQGDYGFVRVLEAMGAKVRSNDLVGQGVQIRGDEPLVDTIVAGPAKLRGIDADMRHISDTVMTVAAIAPLGDGPTTIRNIGNIRLKETDRLAALVTELKRLGQEVAHGDDWLRVTPKPLPDQPVTVECYRDHRLAMAFAILGACTGMVKIADPACVAKTYPGFWDDLAACCNPVRPS